MTPQIPTTHIFLSPLKDPILEKDLGRIGLRGWIEPLVLGYQYAMSVRQVVRKLTHPQMEMLLLPDDPTRHNELIEHVKACALHIGLPVLPLGRYLNDPGPAHPPASTTIHPVCANAEPVEAGSGHR